MRNTVSRQRQTLHTEYSVRLGSTDRPPLGDKSLRLGGGNEQRESTFSVFPVLSLGPSVASLEEEERGPKRERNLGPAPAVPAEISGEFFMQRRETGPTPVAAECSLCRCTHSVEARLSPVGQWTSLCTTARRDGSLAATWKSPVKRKVTYEKTEKEELLTTEGIPFLFRATMASIPPSAPAWRTMQIPKPLQRLFDHFPLRAYDANDLPERAQHLTTSDLPTLFVFSTDADARLGLPSFNPGCLKWQVCCVRTPLHPPPFALLPSASIFPVSPSHTP